MNNNYSFNNYKHKNMRDTSLADNKIGFAKIFVIMIICSIVFFIVCSVLESTGESSTPEDCNVICNGSFSISNGKCVCSNY